MVQKWNWPSQADGPKWHLCWNGWICHKVQGEPAGQVWISWNQRHSVWHLIFSLQFLGNWEPWGPWLLGTNGQGTENLCTSKNGNTCQDFIFWHNHLADGFLEPSWYWGISQYITWEFWLLYVRYVTNMELTNPALLKIVLVPWVILLLVRISLVALRLGSEMDPYRRDLTNILHSYLVSDSLGPVLGARAWSCKTANNYLGLSRLRNTLETFRRRCLRLPPGLSMFYITFLLYGLMGLTILDHIYSSFL